MQLKNINQFLVITDLDGTFIPNDENEIPQKNLKAAHDILNSNNLFTFATGRSLKGVLSLYKKVKVNAPAVLYNGSCIYDLKKKKVLFSEYQPKASAELLKLTICKFKNCGIGMQNLDDDYIAETNDEFLNLLPLNILSPISQEVRHSNIDDVSKMLTTFIFCKPEDQEEIYNFMLQNSPDELAVVRSGPRYIEIMSRHTSKANGLKKLAKILNIPLKNVAAIGNYYNDIEMLEISGTAFCVESAPEEVKNVCKYIVPEAECGSLLKLEEILAEKWKTNNK